MNKGLTKLKRDVLLNIFFFGGVVVIGVLINVLIINFYDETSLGIFNQAYAIYIFLSQIAVGGVHLSVQHYVPKYHHNRKMIYLISSGALLVSFIISLITTGISYIIIPAFVVMLKSEDVGSALYVTLWGLIFFSFNKIILSVLNGTRQMILFALFQFLRMFFILLFLIFFVITQTDKNMLSMSLAGAELFLFVILFIIHIRHRIDISYRFLFRVMGVLRKFGSKAMIGNILLDLNTKIDVLSLGVFLSDARVGLYSFAATVFEGFSQLVVLLRNNFNPIVTSSFYKKSIDVTMRVIQKVTIPFRNLLWVAGLLSMILYPPAAYILGVKDVLTSSVLYAVLCGGFIATGKFHVMLMIFNQWGQPRLQTLLIFIIAISNLILNFILIPFLEVYGAALGTALSFVIQGFIMRYLLLKYYGVSVSFK